MPRPSLVRRDTDQILSYYQSEHAGRTLDYAPPGDSSHSPYHDSKGSPASEYSSHYSSDDGPSQLPAAPAVYKSDDVAPPTPQTGAPDATSSRSETRHSRRPSVPTEGGADRRRLAIVEIDTPATAPLALGRKRSKGQRDYRSVPADHSSDTMSAGTLFARRGLSIGGLALVAPADASPRAYRDLSLSTPPSTAPVSTGLATPPPSAFHSHARSASEAVDMSGSRRLHHKSSRDVGIVGLSSASTASDSQSPVSPTSDEYRTYAQNAGLGVPLFQTPAKSRSPSPGIATPELSDTSSPDAIRSAHQRLLSTPILGMAVDDGVVTPGIGEAKDIRQPVAGPVIVGLSPELLHGVRNVAAPVSPTSSYYSSASNSTTPSCSIPSLPPRRPRDRGAFTPSAAFRLRST